MSTLFESQVISATRIDIEGVYMRGSHTKGTPSPVLKAVESNGYLIRQLERTFRPLDSLLK